MILVDKLAHPALPGRERRPTMMESEPIGGPALVNSLVPPYIASMGESIRAQAQ